MAVGVNKKSEERALINCLLEFVNLSEIKSPQQVEEIFRKHPWGDPRAPFWKTVAHEKDPEPFRGDQKIFRQVFAEITKRKYDPRGVVANLEEKSPEIHLKIRDVQGVESSVAIKLPAQINFAWSGRGLQIATQPFLSGVEFACWYAVALIYHLGLTHKLRSCRVKLKTGGVCGRFFFPTPRLRSYCSTTHKIIGKRQANVRRQLRFREKSR